ncbi:MAG: sugar-binding transcriptional regulator [Actinomycetaceae bacterium]|nr:sugar-binding transcriptional regulator [Actinomycetaceae bacterium]
MSQSRDDLMLEAAQMYYFEGLTQSQIGERLSITRWTVGRLLEDARKTGIVTITINHPRARARTLEVELLGKLSIDKAIVISGDDESPMAVAQAAAKFLADMRPHPRSLAVSWGRTMAAVADAMRKNWAPGVQVFQTNGGPTTVGVDAVTASIGTIAEKGPGVGHVLPVPTIVGGAEIASHLMQEPAIAGILEGAASADATIFSPGPITKDSVLVQSRYLRPDHIETFEKHGAVGDVMSHFITADGHLVSADLDSRTISLPLETLKNSKLSIAVADDIDKAPALLGASRAGLIDVLITNPETASALLDLAG